MYALYFVCYGAWLLLTHVAHLSLRTTIHKDASNNSNSSESRDQQQHHHHHHQQQQQQKEAGDNGSPNRCLWSDWSKWSRCTVTCEQGVQVRHRSPLNHPTQNYTQCATEENVQEKPCSVTASCYFGSKIYVFPSYSFLFDEDSGNTGRPLTQSSDVIKSHTLASLPLSENSPQPTDAASSPEQLRSTADPWQTQPTDATHHSVFRLPLLRSRTGETWQSQPNGREDSTSNSYCSSFDCSTPDSPDDDQINVWNSIIGDFHEKKRREQQKQVEDDRLKDGEQTTEKVREDTREFGAGESEDGRRGSQHQRRKTEDDGKSDERDRGSSDGNRIVSDDKNYNSDREHERGTGDEHSDHGQNNDDPGEDSGDVFDEDDDRDEWAASGDDGSQDDQNYSDEESGRRRRKNSIPEDGEQDDKEEMEEEDDEQKKRKQRKKRKRKRKFDKTQSDETTQGAEQEGCVKCDLEDENEGCVKCDLKDEQDILLCRLEPSRYNDVVFVTSSDVCEDPTNETSLVDDR